MGTLEKEKEKKLLILKILGRRDFISVWWGSADLVAYIQHIEMVNIVTFYNWISILQVLLCVSNVVMMC